MLLVEKVVLSLRLQVGQLKLIIRYFPGQQPEERSV